LVAWSIGWRSDTRKIHIVLLGLAITLAMTLTLTDLFKDAIGRPRPDLISRCKPDPSSPKDVMVTIDVCTETDHHKLHDGWRSYPSGHSSFAFAGLGWLALYLASQFQVLRPRASLIVVLLCLAPLVAAAMIAISRLEDYRHDVGDVVTGSALGFTVAYFNWRRYFPSLLSRGCDEPHPSPSSGRNSPNGGFRRVRDEEAGVGRTTEQYNLGDE
jgi:diacylglycerol diphosphate phosphatase/phosphatidate phosphatase